MELDLKTFLQPFGTKEVIPKQPEVKKLPLRQSEENKSKEKPTFRLSPFAQIAMSKSPAVPDQVQNMIMSLPLSKLVEEGKKLNPGNPVLLMLPQQDQVRENAQNLAQQVIAQLLKPKEWSSPQTDKKFILKKESILELAKVCKTVLESQPIICKLGVPVKIYGDIHGQYTDLMRFFDLWRSPSDTSMGGDIDSYDYVFLGDYVDRGSHSLETICLLLALKVKYPTQLHLLRGNHEDISINNAFGFAEECAERLADDIEQENSVYKTLNRLFEWLPLAAIIDDTIICLHGGIGSTLNSIEDISRLVRPLEVVHEGVLTTEQQMLIDILWSDPSENDKEVGIKSNSIRDPTTSGNIVCFGPDRVEKFLKDNKLELIIRGHECVMDGFERFAKGQLITVFSATDYCGKHKNAGAALVVQKNFEIVPKLIFPIDTTAQTNWIENNKRPPTPLRAKQKDNLSSSFD